MPPTPDVATEKRSEKISVTGEWLAPNRITLLVADSIEIQPGGVMNVGKTLQEVRTQQLIMHKGSTIKIDGALREFRLQSTTTTIGAACTISGRGTLPGDDGTNLKLYLGKAAVGQLTVSTLGAQGKVGPKGAPGSKGRDADCTTMTGGGRGGTGNKGGQGGMGGRGGHVLIALHKDSPNPKLLQVKTQGGPGGPGGPGGDPGRPGRGCTCLLFITLPGGGRGQGGPKGDQGPEGAHGTARVVHVEAFTRFEDI